MTLVFLGPPAGHARLREQQARLAALIARSTPAGGCGPAIPIAPARGPSRVVTPKVVMPDPKSDNGWKIEETGWRGFQAAQAIDIFDDVERLVAKVKDTKGKPMKTPFTKGQVNIARFYRDLVERHDAGGMKLASLEGRTGGGGAGRNFMDAYLAEGFAIDRLREAIGGGVALAVRRVRRSARGTDCARLILDRVLVDAICLKGRSFGWVLEGHGWAKTGRNVRALTDALAAALDRMQGYPENFR